MKREGGDMTGVTAGLAAHHKHCDEDFALAEEAARTGDWGRCEAAFARFRGEIEAHFAAEENILFPGFERRTGAVAGPTRVMRMEHAQMRSLLDQMSATVAARDAVGLSGTAETLLIMMQQHNLKEENILYPMCDQALAGDADLEAMLRQALEPAASGMARV
jgi:iron-sulfur cluster repair protein YtfE (RIC family)